MELPTTLKVIEGSLKLRREMSNPYNLLLTSSVSLTPEILNNICGSDEWHKFCAWMLQYGPEDRIGILKAHIHESPTLDGYHALAKLVESRYFSTIITTNVDSFLEDALLDRGVRSFEKLVIPRDTDEYIANILEREPRGIRIVKLRGSLDDGIIPETFPEAFDVKEALRSNLANYLNQDIVIVGSIEREKDLRRLLSFSRKKTIYYATPEEPDSNDDVVRAIRGRGHGNNINASLIFGTYGDFNLFFKTLESILPSSSITHNYTNPLAKNQHTQKIQEATKASSDSMSQSLSKEA